MSRFRGEYIADRKALHNAVRRGSGESRGRTKPCENCSRLWGALRHGRCAACAKYWRTRGAERPVGAVDLRRIFAVRAENHPAWRGDVARDETKRARAQRAYSLAACESCGKKATDRHHIDGDPGNNAPENVARLCRRCHMMTDGRLEIFLTTCMGIRMRGIAKGNYPDDWNTVAAAVKDASGRRCVRCLHPDDPSDTPRGMFCDVKCRHEKNGKQRVLTVHHMNGDKADCRWFNLLPLCQVCHLQIQGKVIPEVPYLWAHTEWFTPYACGFYAAYYGGQDITREEADADPHRWLKLGQPWLYSEAT